MTRPARQVVESSPHNGTPNTTAKKRKASELQDEPNGHGTQPAPKPAARKPVTHAAKTVGDSVPYNVEVPAKSASEEIDKANDVFRAHDTPEGQELAVEYAVRPGNKWSNLRAYRNVKLNETTFTTGQIIYVNKTYPVPTPPDDGASDAEFLQYDKENMWIGKIAQAKAESDKAVYLRVFWLYWPHELPMGRQPYHGNRELIMSNAMEIIDAQTISCAAEVSHWNEDDDEHDGKQKERFWRQTFDVTKYDIKKKKGGLSALRKHCICGEEYNPDGTMYKCLQDSCGTWNHEECVMDAVLKHAYKGLQKGTLDDEMAGKVAALAHHHKTLAERMRVPAEKLGQGMSRVMHAILDPGVEEIKHESTLDLYTSASSKKRGLQKRKSGSKPWDGVLEASIEISDAAAGTGTVLATIKVLPSTAVPGARGVKAKGAREAKEWKVKVDCLKCGKPLD